MPSHNDIVTVDKVAIGTCFGYIDPTWGIGGLYWRIRTEVNDGLVYGVLLTGQWRGTLKSFEPNTVVQNRSADQVGFKCS